MKAYFSYLLIPVFVMLSVFASSMALSMLEPKALMVVNPLDLPRAINAIRNKEDKVVTHFNQSAFVIPNKYRTLKKEKITRVASINNSQGMTAPKNNKTLQLSALLIDDEKKLAYINGKLVAKGDSVSGYKVTSIDKFGVWLIGSKGKKRIALEYN